MSGDGVVSGTESSSEGSVGSGSTGLGTGSGTASGAEGSTGTAVEAKTSKWGPRKTLATGVSGTVKWFDCRRGFGFLEWTEKGEDVFVHRTAIPFSKRNKEHISRTLDEGEAVVFDVREGRFGSEAWSVSGPDGAVLKGSRYARTKSAVIAWRNDHKDARPRRRTHSSTGQPDKDAKEPKDSKVKAPKEAKKEIGKGDGEGDKAPEHKIRTAVRRKVKAKDVSGEGDAKGTKAEGAAKPTGEGEGQGKGEEAKRRRPRPPRRLRKKADSERQGGSSDDQAPKEAKERPKKAARPKSFPAAAQAKPTAPDAAPAQDDSVSSRVKSMIAKVHGLSVA